MKRTLISKLATLCCLAVVALASTASADILTPVAGGDITGASVYNPVERSFNNSGLTMTGGVLSWTHTYGNDNDTFKVSASPFSVVYDLGDNYDLTDIYLWNSGNGRSLGDYELLTSTDNVSFSAGTTGSFLDIAGTQTDSFSATGRYVQINGLATFGGGHGEVGIGEIKFEGTLASVPEPGSFALAGLGLIGLAGWGVRRRRKA